MIEFYGFVTASQRRDSVRLRLIAERGARCVHCGSGSNLTVDHIIPRSAGGANTDDNLQLLCERCNHKKGDRPDKYRAGAIRMDFGSKRRYWLWCAKWHQRGVKTRRRL